MPVIKDGDSYRYVVETPEQEAAFERGFRAWLNLDDATREAASARIRYIDRLCNAWRDPLTIQ